MHTVFRFAKSFVLFGILSVLLLLIALGTSASTLAQARSYTSEESTEYSTFINKASLDSYTTKPQMLEVLTKPNINYHSDDPAVQALLYEDDQNYHADGQKRGIISEGMTEREKVRAIHDWVSRNIYQDYSGEGGIANDALVEMLSNPEMRRGECMHFSNISVTLCRGAGIPSLEILGLTGVSDTFLDFIEPYYTGEETDLNLFAQYSMTILEEAGNLQIWTAAFIEGEWQYFDTNWDASGAYYGSGRWVEYYQDEAIIYDSWHETAEARDSYFPNDSDDDGAYLRRFSENHLDTNTVMYADEAGTSLEWLWWDQADVGTHISWSKVEGADGYVLIRGFGKGGWRPSYPFEEAPFMVYLEGEDTLEYFDTTGFVGLEPGSVLSYTVQPVWNGRFSWAGYPTMFLQTQQVTFDVQGGSPTEPRTLIKGRELGSPPLPAIEGRIFLGWFTQPAGGERVTENTIISENVTFYAQWKDSTLLTYTINYKAGDFGVGTMEPVTVTAGELYTVPSSTFTSDTSIFDFWEATGAITGYLLPGQSFVVTGDVTLTANWWACVYVESYLVVFLDYDDTRLEIQEHLYGDVITAPVPPARPGYVFVGWDRDFAGFTERIVITKALYEPALYAVAFAPGAHGTFAAVTTGDLSYDSSTPIPPDPTGESGWIFDGWVPALTDTVTDNVTYTAQWRQEQSPPPSDPAPIPEPEPVPDPTPTPTPQPEPVVVIINNPAPATPAPTYITVTPATTQQSSSTQTTETTGQSSKESATAQDETTALPDSDTPLAAGDSSDAQNSPVSIWFIFPVLAIFLIALAVTGWLLTRPRPKRRQQTGW
jgi:hypothetical protein